MISHTHNFCEIHYPRTAGTSRHTAFQKAGCYRELPLGDDKDNQVRDRGTGSWHWTALRTKRAVGADRWDQMFTFSIARHPLESVLSTFRYRKHKLTPPNVHIIDNDVDFRDWVHDFVANHPANEQAELGYRSRFWTDENDDCLVDKIYDFAKLPEAWVDICNRIGIEVDLPDINGTGRQSVDQHYTPEMKQIVMARFEEETPLLETHNIHWEK